jgi:predicted SprT family Zn-dependent metalloprotease
MENMENKKKERPRYTCRFCGKEYITKQGLELHLPSHMGIKPFTCSYCNKGFSQNGVLKVSQTNA